MRYQAVSRFGIIGPTYPFRGGIAHHTTLLYRHMAARYPTGLFISFKRQYPSWLFPGTTDRDPSRQPLAVPCERLVDPWNPLSWWQTARRVAQFAPQLLVIPWWVTFWALPTGVIARLVRRNSPTRIVFVHHNVLPHEPRRWDPTLARFALKPGHGHVVQSGVEGERLRRLLPGAAPLVASIPIYDMLADQMPDRIQARRQLELPVDAQVILLFGFVRPYKGLQHLLAALPAVRQRLPNVRLVIAGEFWGDKMSYLAQIARLGLEEAVVVRDAYIPNEQVASYFAAANVVVLPYVHATQSAVVPLAFGYKRPVITTRVGGLPELVRDGENGLLVPPQDSTALADAICRYFEQGLEKPLSANLAAEQEAASWETLLDAVEAAYAQPAAG